ncbi:MAG: hypothetical protein ACK5HR_04600 [Mycoplasmatales bacterium]
MKPKKIENSFLIIIFSITLLYVIVFAFSLWVVRKNYYTFKYKNVYNYYENHLDDTLEDLLKHSYAQGFSIVQNQEESNEILQIIMQEKNLQTPLNMVTLKFNNNNGEFLLNIRNMTVSLSLNPNIVNDITYILYVFGSIVLILFLSLMYVMYFFIRKIIIKPLLLISSYIDNLTKFKRVKYPILPENNEINQILSRIILLDQSVEQEINNKHDILRAISHEFRTPLAHIVTILYLYETKVDKYQDFQYTKEQIIEIIEENKKLVTMTLESFSDDSGNVAEDINITKLITEQIKVYASENINKTVTIDLKEIVINANIISINLIINNLLSNISKYSLSYIKIYFLDGELIFQNDYDINKEIKTNVGSTIIHSLTKSENIKMKQKLENGIYTTVLKLN